VSVISFLGTGAVETMVKLTTTGATDILVASDKAIAVAAIQVNETAAQTPNLTMAVTDGTTTYYLGAGGKTWNANAMTAKQSVEFSPFVLSRGYTLKATSSGVGGGVDVLVLSDPLV